MSNAPLPPNSPENAGNGAAPPEQAENKPVYTSGRVVTAAAAARASQAVKKTPRSKNGSGKPAEKVSAPFLRGNIVDGTTPKTALSVFGGMVIAAVAYVLLGSAMVSSIPALHTAMNIGLLLMTFMVFYAAGQSQGSIAVNLGEIMYRRRETDREVPPEELARCWHPLKGFVAALLGMLPALVCAVILACIARRQMSSPGALPTWVQGLSSRTELFAPLKVYTTGASLGLEGILRILVRLEIMPWVNLFNSSNADTMLLVERLSPLLLLVPVGFFGFGYYQGTQVRTQVHSAIANSRRGKKKGGRKPRRPQPRQPRQGQQLN